MLGIYMLDCDLNCIFVGNKLPPFPVPPEKLKPVLYKAAENSTCNKLPPFPVPPKKLIPIRNEAAENSTYSQHTKQKTARSPKSIDGSRHSVKSGQKDSCRHSVTSAYSSRHSNSDVSMDYSVSSRHSTGTRKDSVRTRDVSASSRRSFGSSNDSTDSRNSSIRSSHSIGSKSRSSRHRDGRSRHSIGSKSRSSRNSDDSGRSRHSIGSKDLRYRDERVGPSHNISQRHSSRDAEAQKQPDMFPMPTASKC
nr:splicing factor Cactin-like isoform X1 [Misgurnus anguillicaudatus]